MDLVLFGILLLIGSLAVSAALVLGFYSIKNTYYKENIKRGKCYHMYYKEGRRNEGN